MARAPYMGWSSADVPRRKKQDLTPTSHLPNHVYSQGMEQSLQSPVHGHHSTVRTTGEHGVHGVVDGMAEADGGRQRLVYQRFVRQR